MVLSLFWREKVDSGLRVRMSEKTRNIAHLGYRAHRDVSLSFSFDERWNDWSVGGDYIEK